VVLTSPDCGGNQWTGVAEDHRQRPKPSARVSSIRSDMSVSSAQ